MDFNYNLLMSQTDLNKIDDSAIIKTRGTAKKIVNERVCNTMNYYSGKYGLLANNPKLREKKAIEETTKASNKDKTSSEKNLLAADIVYYDTNNFETMLLLCNIEDEDIKLLILTIDNTKNLINDKSNLVTRYKQLQKAFVLKSKKLFDLKKVNDSEIANLSSELELLKAQLLQIKNAVLILEEQVNNVKSNSNVLLSELYENKFSKLIMNYGTKNIYHLFNKLSENYYYNENLVKNDNIKLK